MTLATNFGQNVRARRQAKGVTLEAFADEVGLSYSYVGELERGRRNPTLKVVERIAATLGADPIKLLSAGKGSV
jgi:transcriptional regulator with XRE-family HTH domain